MIKDQFEVWMKVTWFTELWRLITQISQDKELLATNLENYSYSLFVKLSQNKKDPCYTGKEWVL